MTSSVSIRPLREGDLELVLDWTAAEGWHVSRNILLACYKCDTRGWLAAECEGKFIGCIAGCILDDNVATGGFYIVDPEYRGKGVGKKLWAARLGYITPRNLCITAVEGRVDINLRNGFQYTSFNILAYMGTPKKSNMEMSYTKGFHLLPYEQSFFKDLLDYDTQIHTIPREGMLRQWICSTSTTTFVAYRNDKIMGYGCMQPIVGGHYHIGPVFADSDAAAEGLFTKLLEQVPEGCKAGFDVPEDNGVSAQVVKQHEMSCELKLVRMCNKGIELLPMDRVYAITSCGISLV